MVATPSSLAPAAARAAHARRGAFYLLALAAFLFVVEAQLRYQTPRPDRPLKVFGGRFVFLTVQVNFLITLYVGLCAVESVFGRRVAVLGLLARHASAVVFALGLFMGVGYYAFVHWHPKTRMVAAVVEDFDWYMHLLHGFPCAFVVADTLFDTLGARVFQPVRAHLDAVLGSLYSLWFVAWTVLCAHLNNGWWPYPFLQTMPVRQKIVLYSMCVAIVPALTAVGMKLRGSGRSAAKVVIQRGNRRRRCHAGEAAR